ncbi:MAG: hypothetical protein JOZ69_04495, partial [Myxococcales bacterium]|nr:hypothetical protein [Myxococcales bacterium]
ITSGTINDWLANVQTNLVQTPGKLEFQLKNTDSDGTLVFIPHYSRYQDRYGIYWKLSGNAGGTATPNVVCSSVVPGDAGAPIGTGSSGGTAASGGTGVASGSGATSSGANGSTGGNSPSGASAGSGANGASGGTGSNGSASASGSAGGPHGSGGLAAGNGASPSSGRSASGCSLGADGSGRAGLGWLSVAAFLLARRRRRAIA